MVPWTVLISSQCQSICILSPSCLDNASNTTSLLTHNLHNRLHRNLHQPSRSFVSRLVQQSRHYSCLYILGLYFPSKQTCQYPKHSKIRWSHLLYIVGI